ALAARVSPRALQEAFRRHLDTTPLGYLRDVRLERAHQDLQTAARDGSATVSDVAYRWGFANLGRFAASYRSRYGHPPSMTLNA
ncbi:helix-turn-helix transcriptional regulator, partial [Streptomyces sp. T-3]|nr:helix-turn-helix transcriptional regulator [Streptomyces sp. T-3]